MGGDRLLLAGITVPSTHIRIRVHQCPDTEGCHKFVVGKAEPAIRVMYYSSKENVLRIKFDKRIKVMKTIKVELCLTILKVLMKKNKKGKKDHLEGSSGFYHHWH